MFRFTIRDVLWLTAFIAVSVGWTVDHSGMAKECRKWKNSFAAANDQLGQLGWNVIPDYEWPATHPIESNTR